MFSNRRKVVCNIAAGVQSVNGAIETSRRNYAQVAVATADHYNHPVIVRRRTVPAPGGYSNHVLVGQQTNTLCGSVGWWSLAAATTGRDTTRRSREATVLCGAAVPATATGWAVFVRPGAVQASQRRGGDRTTKMAEQPEVRVYRRTGGSADG